MISRLTKLAGGIAPQRQPPPFAPQTFSSWFAGHTPRHPAAEPVLVWPDTFTNYFEPEVGIAAVEVLEAAGFRVSLPARWVCCGRPLYDYGLLGTARRYLTRTLDVLRPQIEAGILVIGLEPSCLAVFRDELVNVLPHDEDANGCARRAMCSRSSSPSGCRTTPRPSCAARRWCSRTAITRR